MKKYCMISSQDGRKIKPRRRAEIDSETDTHRPEAATEMHELLKTSPKHRHIKEPTSLKWIVEMSGQLGAQYRLSTRGTIQST